MDNIPMSRTEEILQSKIDGTPYNKPPMSRVEELLLEIEPGGGGTTDYDKLSNRPVLNGVTISGDKNSADYSIGTNDYNQLVNKPTINGKEITGDVSTDELETFDYKDVTYDSDDENLTLGYFTGMPTP